MSALLLQVQRVVCAMTDWFVRVSATARSRKSAPASRAQPTRRLRTFAFVWTKGKLQLTMPPSFSRRKTDGKWRPLDRKQQGAVPDWFVTVSEWPDCIIEPQEYVLSR